MTCPHCGTVNAAGTDDCSDCGRRLHDAHHPDQASAAPPDGARTAIKAQLTVGRNTGTATALHIGVAQNVIVTFAGDHWTLHGGSLKLDQTEVEDKRAQIPQSTKTYAPTGMHLLNELLLSYRRHQLQSNSKLDLPTLNLKCFNQFLVRQKLSYPERSTPVIELTGPSGIGKSHILRAICARSAQERETNGIPSVDWEGWQTIYVDANHERMTYEQLMNEFARRLTAAIESEETIERPLRQVLMHAASMGFARFLFVLDNADAIDFTELARLAGDEGPVGRGTRNATSLARHIVLRLVVASRRPHISQALSRNREGNNISGVFPLHMDPLDHESVHEMLIDRLEASKFTKMAPDSIDRLAAAISHVSGGHPQAISFILDRLAKEYFAISPEEMVKQYQPIVLHIVQKDIIGHSSVEEYLILNVLSIFRRVSIRLILRLCTCGLLPANLPSPGNADNVKAWADWIEQMRETTSHIRPIKDESAVEFAVHPVLRHVLPMDLQAVAPERLRELHEIAFTIYDEDLRHKDSAGIRYGMQLDKRPLYMMEAIYHYIQVQLLAKRQHTAIQHEPILELIRAYMAIYHEVSVEEHGGFEPDPHELRKRWSRDNDLQSTIVALVDDDVILATIENMLR